MDDTDTAKPAGSRGRGLASADKATRQRVARKGGQASHGGGRRRRTPNMDSSSMDSYDDDE